MLLDDSHEMPASTLCEYFVGRLDQEASQSVEAHLAACFGCRELLRIMSLLSGAPPEEVNPPAGDHPTMEEMVCFYRDKGSLDAQTVQRLESHLRECPDCASEITYLDELESELRRASQ